jgi:anaerobic ribonucleoside-triphosphate reductase activating protein
MEGEPIMNYHNITTCDMKNGDGLRVVLWVAGCSHHCHGCHNPQTWDPNSGIPFDEDAEKELFEKLSEPYITGITFSGGDPLYIDNRSTILHICQRVKEEYPTKDIWLYTGYTLLDLLYGDSAEPTATSILTLVDTVVDGEYQEANRDTSLEWRGSSNQKVYRKLSNTKTFVTDSEL